MTGLWTQAAGLSRHPLTHLLPGLLPALIPLLILLLGLDVFCLVNLVRAKSVRNAPKLAWAIVILFVSAPLGAILYLFFGMNRTGGSAGTKSVRPMEPAPTAPVQETRPVVRSAGTAQFVLTVTGITRDYSGTGLFDVDLAVPRGSVYGLVGLNGAGKTTLLSIIAGTRHADRGSVKLAVDRRRVAVCPDVPEFDGWLTAAEAVDLARSLVASATSPVGAEAAEVANVLRTVGLAEAANRRIGGLSRGMLQRLGLACALVGDPELLILDEPTSALDPAGRADMLSLVAGMRGTRTVIFSSHILADVQRVADHVGILRDGRLLYEGGTRELMDTYLTPSWLLRLAGGVEPVATALARQSWVIRVEPAEQDVLTVEATSIEAGERGIPAVIAGCGARQVSCEPAAADLESAFLALTGASETAAMTGSA